MSGLLQAALDYANRGRPVFPVDLDKRPLTDHGFKEASCDKRRIRCWWAEHANAGIGTPTGPKWFVLDIDDESALAVLLAQHGAMPPTVEVVTPRPGRHIYLRGRATNSKGRLPDGVHVRGQGGYVLLPPSPHRNGAYEWRTAPDEAPVAHAPAWLLELLAPAATNGSAPPVVGDIPLHERNSTLASMAGTMRRRGFHEAAITVALLQTNKDRCVPALPDREVRRIAASISRYRPAYVEHHSDALTFFLRQHPELA